MVLYVVAPGKAYYAIRFEDVPGEYILGGQCLACAHRGPVNRFVIERRWHALSLLRRVDPFLKCTNCGNGDHNRFIVFGRQISRDQVKKAAASGVQNTTQPLISR